MVKKLASIVIVLLLSEILILYTGRLGILNATQDGTISPAELLIKGHFYLLLIPMILGPVGVLIRQKTGWIATATFFYSMATGNILVALTVAKSGKEVSPLLLLMIVIVTQLIFMNMSDIKAFFKIEPAEKLIKENFISVGLVILIGVLFLSLNYF